MFPNSLNVDKYRERNILLIPTHRVEPLYKSQHETPTHYFFTTSIPLYSLDPPLVKKLNHRLGNKGDKSIKSVLSP